MTLWGGRFKAPTDEHMRRFNDSIGFDKRMYSADIQASIAYARALARIGLLTVEERDQLVAGLEQVRVEFAADAFEFQSSDEDIHTAVERRLSELVGPVAGKLHTGRSRNDQVATDLRLYMLTEMDALQSALAQVQTAIVKKAEEQIEIVMPGYTHLQQAQPLLFSHWLMAYFWRFQRDQERLAELTHRTSVSPLGAGALAGNPFGLDRDRLAAEMGFAAVSENSVDAVCDRDYLVEFLAWAALVQVHLSSLAEDLIIWSSLEFGFVQVDEAFATGSSLMPQKRNPDSLELMRGKTGRVTGHLAGLLTTLKGLPSAYNKDLQEDKEAIFDVIDTLQVELPVAAAVIGTLVVNGARMAAALHDALLATDLADYLVRKGLPFRQSHHLVGQLVKLAEDSATALKDLDLARYQAIHPAFDQDVYQVFHYQRSVEARDVRGGTAPQAVRVQISRARTLLEEQAAPGPANSSSKSKNMEDEMNCLECDAELDLSPDVEVGEIISCPDCGVEWEVMAVDPVTLELAPEVEEDWGE